MSEKIESVLSEEEWRILRADPISTHEAIAGWLSNAYHSGADAANDAARIIAAMNDRLPDSDPRKITREKIATLRSGLDCVPQAEDEEHAAYQAADTFLDALESYLPPSAPLRTGAITPTRLRRIGAAEIACPRGCGTTLRTSDAKYEEQAVDGLRWVDVPCSTCGTHYTIEMTDTSPAPAPSLLADDDDLEASAASEQADEDQAAWEMEQRKPEPPAT